jgi:hypothetical protein
MLVLSVPTNAWMVMTPEGLIAFGMENTMFVFGGRLTPLVTSSAVINFHGT